MNPAVAAAEAEYRRTRELLEVARQVERDAARMHQISIEQLGHAWRAAVGDTDAALDHIEKTEAQ